MTKTELAKVLGISPRQVDNLVAEGIPRTREGRTWDYGPDAVDWYWRRKLEKLDQPAPGTNGSKPDYWASRARKELAQAELAEFQLAEKRGQMLSIADHERILGGILDRLHAGHVNAPSKWAPQLVGVKSIAAAQVQLDAMLEEIMRELVEVGEALARDDGDPPTRQSSKRPRRRKKTKRRARR